MRIASIGLLATLVTFGHAEQPKGDLLCIGDSIRMGYAKYLNCVQSPINGGASYEVENGCLDQVAGKHWKTIIFNAGLHDGILHTDPQAYCNLLRKTVKKLKPCCDHLYFCSTTPGRRLAPANSPESIELLNCGALGVMNQEHVDVIDLYSLAMKHREWWKSEYDIHYTEEGYKGFAAFIHEKISQHGDK